MRKWTRLVLLGGIVFPLASVPVAAQRAVSVGIGAGLPSEALGGDHGFATLELRSSRFPVHFRAELGVIQGGADTQAYHRWYQAGGSFIVRFVERPLSPYALAGLSFEIDRPATGPPGGTYRPDGTGLRTGLGLRYRVGERVLFAEGAHHWGLDRRMITFGVQF